MDPKVRVATVSELPAGFSSQGYVVLGDGRADVGNDVNEFVAAARATFRALGLNVGGVADEKWHLHMGAEWWVSGPEGVSFTVESTEHPAELIRSIVDVFVPDEVVESAEPEEARTALVS